MQSVYNPTNGPRVRTLNLDPNTYRLYVPSTQEVFRSPLKGLGAEKGRLRVDPYKNCMAIQELNVCI